MELYTAKEGVSVEMVRAFLSVFCALRTDAVFVIMIDVHSCYEFISLSFVFARNRCFGCHRIPCSRLPIEERPICPPREVYA